MNNFMQSLKVATAMACLIILTVAVTLWLVREEVFSPPQSRVSAGAPSVGPARFMSTIDLQRELNILYPKLELKVDGVYGPRTQAAHERAVGDQYSKELMKEIR